MSHLDNQQREIYKLAVGMFGAVPGVLYFGELHNVLAGRMSLNEVYNALTGSPAFQTLFAFTPVATNAQFTDAFLDRLLGPDVSAAGRAFAEDWVVNALDAGASRGDAIKAAIDALDAVSHSDADFGQAAQRLDSRIDLARHYTESLNTSSPDIEFLRSLLDSGIDPPLVGPAAQTASFDIPAIADGAGGQLDGTTDLSIGIIGLPELTIGNSDV